MVPYAEWLYWSALAASLHAILWWHVFPSGDFQPYLMPVDDAVWRLITH